MLVVDVNVNGRRIRQIRITNSGVEWGKKDNYLYNYLLWDCESGEDNITKGKLEHVRKDGALRLKERVLKDARLLQRTTIK